MLTGGSRDNRELEARPDVLVYTSDVLDRALEIVGPVHADLHVSSSVDHTDFFVRVCDVYPDGRSMNVCDGLQRFTPSTIAREPDGSFRATVAMWPAAYRFAPGHRVRVQVSSGSHPVYARNLGTGESVLTATSMQAADQSRVPRLVGGPAAPWTEVACHVRGRTNARGESPGVRLSQPAASAPFCPHERAVRSDRTSVLVVKGEEERTPGK